MRRRDGSLETEGDGEMGQEELDTVLKRAMNMCPICNALAGTDTQVKVHPASQ